MILTLSLNLRSTSAPRRIAGNVASTIGMALNVGIWVASSINPHPKCQHWCSNAASHEHLALRILHRCQPRGVPRVTRVAVVDRLLRLAARHCDGGRRLHNVRAEVLPVYTVRERRLRARLQVGVVPCPSAPYEEENEKRAEMLRNRHQLPLLGLTFPTHACARIHMHHLLTIQLLCHIIHTISVLLPALRPLHQDPGCPGTP